MTQSTIIQNSSEGHQFTVGFPIVDMGLATGIPTVAINDSTGPQDLFLECGDPIWYLESTNSTNRHKIVLWQECEKVFEYTRPDPDSLFPVTGGGPLFAGTLFHGVDGGGNFYWVGLRFTADGAADNIRIRKVDLAGTVTTATIDARSLAPSSLPSPDNAFLFDSTDNARNKTIKICIQQDGFLVLVEWAFSNGSTSKSAAGIVAIDSSLAPTAALVNWSFGPDTWVGLWPEPRPIPLPVGMALSRGVGSYRILPDGTVSVAVSAIAAFQRAGYFNEADDNNWFVTANEMIYIYDPVAKAIDRYDLATLTVDPLSWSPTDDLDTFVVSASEHRVACHETNGSTGHYRVYDGAGTLLLEQENQTPYFVANFYWPCERHDNPLSILGYSHTIDGHVCFRAGVRRPIYVTRQRVAKLTLDSILAFRILAINTLANTNEEKWIFPRGQWPHFDYSAWTV